MPANERGHTFGAHFMQNPTLADPRDLHVPFIDCATTSAVL